jgi:hypothetical protein
VSATLEPDIDLDGFGDESQDNCLGVPNASQADSTPTVGGMRVTYPNAPALQRRSSAPQLPICSRDQGSGM